MISLDKDFFVTSHLIVTPLYHVKRVLNRQTDSPLSVVVVRGVN